MHVAADFDDIDKTKEEETKTKPPAVGDCGGMCVAVGRNSGLCEVSDLAVFHRFGVYAVFCGGIFFAEKRVKHMKKKLISMLLSLQMIVNCIPYTAFAVGETSADTTGSDTTIVEGDGNEVVTPDTPAEDGEASAEPTTTATSDAAEQPASSEVVTPETPEQVEPSEEQTPSGVTELKFKVEPVTVYYGQETPEISEIVYYFEDEEGNKFNQADERGFIQIGDKGNVKVNSIWFDNLGPEVGEYNVKASISNFISNYTSCCIYDIDGNPIVYNDTKNISTHAIDIIEYTPDVTAEGYEDNNKLILYAPKNYYISKGNSTYSFGTETQIEYNTWEINNGSVTYYLRNNDSDSPYYGAISKALTYEPTNATKLPYITSITVEKVTEDAWGKILKALTFGAYSSNDVTMKISVKADKNIADVGITLKASNKEIALLAKEALSFSAGDTQTYECTFTAAETPDQWEKLILSITSPKGSKTYGLTFSEENGVSWKEEKDAQGLMIENVDPDIDTQITEDYIQVYITDKDSGLAKVEYQLDRSGDWREGMLSGNGEFNQKFERKADDNFTVIAFRATDYAGNQIEEEYSLLYEGVRLSVEAHQEEVDSSETVEGETAVEEPTVATPKANCQIADTGVFANGPIVLTLTFDEVVSDVMLCWGLDDSKQSAKFSEVSSNQCSLVLGADTPVTFKMTDVKIQFNDENNLDRTISLSSTHETLAEDRIVIEQSAPEADFSLVQEKQYYKEDDLLEFSLKDTGPFQSGIDPKTVVVTAKVVTANGQKLSYTYSIGEEEVDISCDLGDLEDGQYTLDVEFADYAGNHIQQTATFVVDKTAPEGFISLVPKEELDTDDPQVVMIDDESWFKYEDRDYVKIRLTVTEDNFDFVTLSINDMDNNRFLFNYEGVHPDTYEQVISKERWEETETGWICDFIIWEFSVQPTIESEILSDIFTVQFTDKAGNVSTQEEDDTLCIRYDRESPKIDSIVVRKVGNTVLDQVLNVLTFGIYSNDDVMFMVKAHDGYDTLDSEISSVEFNGLPMTYKESEQAYIYTFAHDDAAEVLTDVSIVVTDGVGRTNEAMPNVIPYDSEKMPTEVAETLEEYCIMLENNSPKLIVTPPAGDITKTDGYNYPGDQIWLNSEVSENQTFDIAFSDLNSGLYQFEIDINKEKYDAESVDRYSKEEGKKSQEIAITAKDFAGDADGCFELTFTALDNCGNLATEERTFYVDKTKPEITNVHFTIPDASNIQDVEELIDYDYVVITDYGFFFKRDLNLVVDVEDDGQENKAASSGLYEVQYQLIPVGETTETVEVKSIKIDTNGQVSITVPAEFKGHIKLEAIDYVGNSSGPMTLNDSLVLDTPEKHAQEQHFEIPDLPGTEYRDAKNQPLYTGSVTYAVTIIDTVSGIRDFSYAMQSERETYEMRTIAFSNYDHYVIGTELGDGWRVAAVDENLVTKVTKEFPIGENNDVVLSFAMTDRAGNTSETATLPITVDTIAPVVNVTYQELGDQPSHIGNYYQNERRMTVTVTERNFDAGRMQVLVNGVRRDVAFSGPAEGFVYTGTVDFSEGDYVIAVSGTDLGNHAAEVTYQDNQTEFFVDLTKPLLVTNFDELISTGTKNHFNTEKTVQITVNEHNFDPNQANVTIKSAGPEAEGQTAGTTDDFVTSWTSNGDEHTMTLKTFAADGVYQVLVSVTDRSGRSASEESVVYEIDLTAPKHNAPDNTVVHVIDNDSTKIPGIEMQDHNFKEMTYTLVSYHIEMDEQGVGYQMVTDQTTDTLTTDKFQPTNKQFAEDGVYEYTLAACDIAGNVLENVKVTYIVKRDSAFMVYIPDSYDDEDNDKDRGLYAFDQKGTKADNFEDVQLEAYLPTGTEFTLQIDGETVGEEYLTVQKDSDSIHLTTHYSVTLSKEYITTYYNDAVDVELLLNAVAKNGSEAQEITLGRIFIDNEAPDGSYEDEVLNLGYFDGFYGVSSKTIRIQGVSSDLYKNACVVLDNGEPLDLSKVNYDSERNVLSFDLGKGSHTLEVTLTDNAGNTTNLETPPMIYIGSFWNRWKFMLIGIIAGVAALIGLLIWLILKKKNTKNVI